MAKIGNWGMYPIIEAELVTPVTYSQAIELVKSSETVIARGNGRCYGDSALQKKIISTLRLNKFLDFNKQTGVLHCQSGVLLSEILDVIVPAGYFLPVSPGTKQITIGGAVASNIHGKNHHKEGSISNYVKELVLLNEQGELITCSPTSDAIIFTDTIGGMGLTGIILSVTLCMKPIESAYIKQKIIKAKNLDEVLSYFDDYKLFTYSVAWIDCLATGAATGRSLLMLGEHAGLHDLDKHKAKHPFTKVKTKRLNVPFVFPAFVLSKTAIKAFNFLFYYKQRKREQDKIVHYEPYFYPLDKISNWNRIYGKNGFLQYQFVIPYQNGKENLRRILAAIQQSKCGAFLAVLKTFGPSDSSSSALSFPAEGYTLALDFKVNDKVFKLLDVLDTMVLDAGGRLYLTKDARMKKETFFKSYRINYEHPPKFNSMQSQRLGI